MVEQFVPREEPAQAFATSLYERKFIYERFKALGGVVQLIPNEGGDVLLAVRSDAPDFPAQYRGVLGVSVQSRKAQIVFENDQARVLVEVDSARISELNELLQILR